MRNILKVFLILTILLFLTAGAYIAYSVLSPPSVPVSISEMKYCKSAEDCMPVGCGCSCSGCGGFSYDDIVNKKYADLWYKQNKCEPAKICPTVCCPQRSIVCSDNNVCGAMERPSAE